MESPSADEIRIVRFELYPRESPTCYCVGFSESFRGRSKYGDCQVTLQDAAGKTDDEISQLAWTQLAESFKCWRDAIADTSPIIGSTFVPPSA